MSPIICEWYALCTNPTTTGVVHPILGVVAICARCADKHDITPTHTLTQEV